MKLGLSKLLSLPFSGLCVQRRSARALHATVLSGKQSQVELRRQAPSSKRQAPSERQAPSQRHDKSLDRAQKQSKLREILTDFRNSKSYLP